MTFDVITIHNGSFSNVNGNGFDFHVNDGIGGLKFGFDMKANLNSVGIAIGPGFMIGGSGTVTGSYSIRQDVIPLLMRIFGGAM